MTSRGRSVVLSVGLALPWGAALAQPPSPAAASVAPAAPPVVGAAPPSPSPAFPAPVTGRPAAARDGRDGEDSDEDTDEATSAQPNARGGAAKPVLPLRDGMLRLPGGGFTMGTADRAAPANERPPRSVRVTPFWIDRTEVTVGAYRACVEHGGCSRPPRSSTSCTYDLDEPELPVSCVRWRDADAYCRSLGRRLPSEAEWEFAARGTHGYRYPWGAAPASCFLAVTLTHETTSRSCVTKHPAKVGSHPYGASVWGVLDLSGNLEEWTADWYAETVAEGAAPRAGASHVLRGGGWLSTPNASRATARDWGSELEAGANVGFRCVRGDEPGDAAALRGDAVRPLPSPLPSSAPTQGPSSDAGAAPSASSPAAPAPPRPSP